MFTMFFSLVDVLSGLSNKNMEEMVGWLVGWWVGGWVPFCKNAIGDSRVKMFFLNEKKAVGCVFEDNLWTYNSID